MFLQISTKTLPLWSLYIWLPFSHQLPSPWRSLCHQCCPQWRKVSWCVDRCFHQWGGEHRLSCQNILHPWCGWLSYFQDISTGSPLVVQNPSWCYPLIQDKTSACDIKPTLQWRVVLPALWYPQPSAKEKDQRSLFYFVSRKLYALLESNEAGVEVIMTGRKSICVLCFTSSFQLECGNWGPWTLITYPTAQSVLTQCEEWLLMSQIGDINDGEKHDSVYCCLFSVRKWKNLHYNSSKDLSFVGCLQLYHVDSCSCLWIWQRWCQRGDFDPTNQPIEWNLMSLWIQTNWLSAVFISTTSIQTTWSLVSISILLAVIPLIHVDPQVQHQLQPHYWPDH